MAKKKKIDIQSEENDRERKTPGTADVEPEVPGEAPGPEDNMPEPDEASKEPTEHMEQTLARAEKEAGENYERFLRVSAEFDNYKKRTAREMADFRKYANESLIREILPLVDNLERAVVSGDGEKQEGIVEGVALTLKGISKVFEKFHVTQISALNEPFDPAFHQAVMQEESDEHPDNTVIRELQKGYMIHERLLRPSMVVVSKAVAGSGGDRTK